MHMSICQYGFKDLIILQYLQHICMWVMYRWCGSKYVSAYTTGCLLCIVSLDNLSCCYALCICKLPAVSAYVWIVCTVMYGSAGYMSKS